YIEHDARTITVVGVTTLVFGVLLLLAEIYGRKRRGMETIGWRDSLFISFAQALALIPGASRSGVTITAGMFAGLTREAAARFSFFLSIPAVTAAGLFEFRDILKHGSGGVSIAALALATAVSFAVGYGCIAFLLRFLRTRATYVFSIYRIALAVAILALLR
ncbi:MAG: undecaprenyl-diphosphate phosphatase, partial [Myxococcota bacterium]